MSLHSTFYIEIGQCRTFLNVGINRRISNPKSAVFSVAASPVTWDFQEHVFYFSFKPLVLNLSVGPKQ